MKIKSSQDKDLAEWQYIGGTAYRWAEIDKKGEEDEAPLNYQFQTQEELLSYITVA